VPPGAGGGEAPTPRSLRVVLLTCCLFAAAREGHPGTCAGSRVEETLPPAGTAAQDASDARVETQSGGGPIERGPLALLCLQEQRASRSALLGLTAGPTFSLSEIARLG
jgi:hypothetical protein